MPQTISEKILSEHAGTSCSAGRLVGSDIDLVYLTDGSAPAVIDLFSKLGKEGLFDPCRIAIVLDHYVPAPTALVARQHQTIREFARRHGCVLFDAGEGVCHHILGEAGLIRPGALVVGADSHTVTYGAFGAFATGIGSTDAAVAMAGGRLWFRVPESIRLDLRGNLMECVDGKDLALHLNSVFGTEGATYKTVEIYERDAPLDLDDLSAVCNTSVEWGAKAAIAASRCPVKPDTGAMYSDRVTVDLPALEPSVAEPHAVNHVVPVRRAEQVRVNMCVIGTCSGGRTSDLRKAARVLKGRQVSKGVQLLIVPASRRVLREAAREGVLDVLLSAGATITAPGCGPCCGTGNGVPGDDECVVSTANRNFLGRMGNPRAKIYLGSAATAAASAVAGRLADPRDFV